jgi:hypothetical protein
VQDLDNLHSPFTTEETDQVIKDLPSGKSPRPGGFNSDFIKKCCKIMSTDFYKLCSGFNDNSICLQSINGSFIVLIPKSENPLSLNDYRLQTMILRVIHQNQYGFIRSWSSQDCLAWSFEYLHICHKSKEMVILKIDFEKSFDKVEHEVILQAMNHKRFPCRRMEWIKGILTTGTSSVLLKGTLGKVLHYRRGVWQRNVLSPLLFVLAANLSRSIISKAKDIGLLKHPINVDYTADFHIIQYVDDTLMIMEACPLQLFTLKALLNSFAESTGLKVNYPKSYMYEINLSQEKLLHLASTLNCQASTLPFTYLGLPLSLSKPTVQDCLPMVDRVETRLVSTSIFLTQAGKL